MNDKSIRFQAELVNGKCPTCSQTTLLVGITKEFYRCMPCGSDCEQHVNGKISYLPVIHPPNGAPYIKDWVDG